MLYFVPAVIIGPMAELLAPHRKDLRGVYETEFRYMAKIEVPVEQLEAAREQLIEQIQKGLTEEEKRFLLSFKARQPNWNLLGIDGQLVSSTQST